jgi:hypothetical protein
MENKYDESSTETGWAPEKRWNMSTVAYIFELADTFDITNTHRNGTAGTVSILASVVVLWRATVIEAFYSLLHLLCALVALVYGRLSFYISGLLRLL